MHIWMIKKAEYNVRSFFYLQFLYVLYLINYKDFMVGICFTAICTTLQKARWSECGFVCHHVVGGCLYVGGCRAIWVSLKIENVDTTCDMFSGKRTHPQFIALTTNLIHGRNLFWSLEHVNTIKPRSGYIEIH